MLSCKEVTQRAGDWTDGQLRWHERLAVRLHLLVCAMCRRFLHQYRLAADTAAAHACRHEPGDVDRVLAHIDRHDPPAP